MVSVLSFVSIKNSLTSVCVSEKFKYSGTLWFFMARKLSKKELDQIDSDVAEFEAEGVDL